MPRLNAAVAGSALELGGIARLSSCDWPGELVATLFTQGCPWACRYCHNAGLIPRGPGRLDWPEVLAFLSGRRGLLDGVVISGGEPTLQKALPEALQAIRAMGFRTGLHTAGPYPGRLARVLPLLDWVGFDVKGPWEAYARITGVPGGGRAARESLLRLRDSGVAYDLRTTVHPALLCPDDLEAMDAGLAADGLPPARRQPFRSEGCSDPDLRAPAL